MFVGCGVFDAAARLLRGCVDWCGAALVEMPWRAVGNAVCLSKARVVHVARRIRWRGDFWARAFCLQIC